MFTINHFAKMVGLSPSTIRYYQRLGLLDPIQKENGYFYYTMYDAFTVNELRSMQSYGFSVKDAIYWIKKGISEKELFKQVAQSEKELIRQKMIIDVKMERIEQLRNLSLSLREKTALVHSDGFIFVYASIGDDFQESAKNAELIQKFVDVLPISSYAISLDLNEMLAAQNPTLNYGIALPEKYLDFTDASSLNGAIRLAKGTYLSICFFEDDFKKICAELPELFCQMKVQPDQSCQALLLPGFLRLTEENKKIDRIFIRCI